MLEEIIRELAGKPVSIGSSRDYSVTFWSSRLNGYLSVTHRQNPSGGYLTASMGGWSMHIDGIDWYDSLADTSHLESLISSYMGSE